MDFNLIYILLACFLGFIMTWSVGSNDLANIMSTTIGSKAVTARQALVIAIIFEFAGAFFGGSGVSNTLRDGIINTAFLAHAPYIFVYAMLASLSAGTVWMILASYLGMPVSVTNTIVSAIFGFGLIVVGPHAIHWSKIASIAASWVFSPSIAAIFSYLLFRSIQKSIFFRPQPFVRAKRYAPVYLFLIGIILSMMVVIKGLQHFNVELSYMNYILIDIASGLVVTFFGWLAIQRITLHPEAKLRAHFASTEKVFSVLMALTACAMVFAHGSNDVSIAVGPMAAVVTIAQSNGQTLYASYVPAWITLLGCTGVVLGLLMYGRKIIETVGEGITNLTPSRAFAATISAATTVIFSTSLGIPLSTTQTLVGGVLGVGLARGIGALNVRVARNIFVSWIITLPIGAGLTIVFYYFFKWLFPHL